LTIKNRYPLPLIGEIIDKIKDYSHYSKLNIHWGYNNVHIKREMNGKPPSRPTEEPLNPW
jgi:hypothetical protein